MYLVFTINSRRYATKFVHILNYVVRNSTIRMVGSEGNESLIVRGVACVDGVVSF